MARILVFTCFIKYLFAPGLTNVEQRLNTKLGWASHRIFRSPRNLLFGLPRRWWIWHLLAARRRCPGNINFTHYAMAARIPRFTLCFFALPSLLFFSCILFIFRVTSLFNNFIVSWDYRGAEECYSDCGMWRCFFSYLCSIGCCWKGRGLISKLRRNEIHCYQWVGIV